MSNLYISFLALRVLESSRKLFNTYGFHHVGINRIVESAKTTKATFYKYFHSKESLIERSLTFQKATLKEEVFVLIYRRKDLTVFEKLKRIFFLQADVEGLYHLLFKSIFEIEKRYPNAYQIVVEYRSWLIDEIYKLLLTSNVNASKQDAHMFLFVIDGAMVQLQGENSVDDRERLVGCFFGWVGVAI